MQLNKLTHPFILAHFTTCLLEIMNSLSIFEGFWLLTMKQHCNWNRRTIIFLKQMKENDIVDEGVLFEKVNFHLFLSSFFC
jgi:hypothetical protein